MKDNEYRGQAHVFEAGVRLGGGGMADVYLGESGQDPDLHVAIKVLRATLDDAARAMFLREAEAAQRVAGPDVVKVVDWGDNPPFIAFEYIQGRTMGKELSERRAQQAYWSESELLDLFAQLVGALDAINRQVIHRDLKPDNIFYLDG